MRFEGQFEALRERLLAGGIAPRRVKRYLGELADHLSELTARGLAAGYTPDEAQIRARALLGDDEDLAQSWLADPRLKSLTARAPWVVFGVLPPLTLLLAAVVQILLLILMMRILGVIGRHSEGVGTLPVLTNLTTFTGNLLVIPAIAALFVAIARRQRLPAVWPLIGIAIILIPSFHWEAAPFVLYSPGWSALRIELRYSGSAVGLSFTPVFLYAWWKAMAAHGLVMTAQYVLTLLPLAWLLCAQRNTALR